MITLLQTDPYMDVSSENVGAIMALGSGFIVFGLISYIFYGFCMMKIFKKAGREDSWAAFIPIYNTIVLIDIVKKPWWWFLLMLIPFVNIVIAIILIIRLAKFFGKDTLYGILILLFGFIMIPVLAFTNAQYFPDALPDDRTNI